jgi:single-stranded-DNA-specific exonuclease
MSATPLVIRRREPLAEPLADLPPVLARVLAARGVERQADIDASLNQLPAPNLAGLDAATARLEQALRSGERILVVGDFDADGATSIALAVRVLRAFGHAAVDYLVPDRFEYGYGLTPELLEPAAAFEPGLILTVDNGIASHSGIAAANSRGIDTVVTDHHLPGVSLPDAAAVVNPNRDDCAFPGKSLAGVGVVFYLLIALRARLQNAGWFGDGTAPSMADFLDLVALGTVADVVRLDHLNRILVEQGLRRIRAGHACAGIHALIEVADRKPAAVCAADLGFAVGPRLNAAGRMADMAVGIQTLLSDGAAAAGELAQQLDALNRERRATESEMRAQAEEELARLQARLDSSAELPAGLALYDERWHQGVIGILAGRVRETVHRPTVVFADGGEGMLKGSMRSIAGLHARDSLAAVEARHPGLIPRFGGHAMAAGLSLRAEDLAMFREAFTHEIECTLGDEAMLREIHTDGALDGSDLELATAETLRAACPWGAGFPEPSFDGAFEVLERRTVGERHLKMRVRPAGAPGPVLDAIHFNATPEALAAVEATAHLVYRLAINDYRGRRRLELIVEHLGPVETDSASE